MAYPYDLSTMTPGQGPVFQTIEGSGKVDPNALNWLKQFVRTDAWSPELAANAMGVTLPNSYAMVKHDDPNAWLGRGVTTDANDGAAGSNLLYEHSSPGFDAKKYDYVREDASRVNDGLYSRDYFDAGGKHTKSEIMNDPASLGKFTSGDLGMVLGGLGAIGGVYALPMLLGGGAAAGGGASFGVVDQGLVGAGLDGVSLGGGAGSGAFLGEGVSSGIPAWDGSLSGAGSWSSAGGLVPGNGPGWSGLTPEPPPANPGMGSGSGATAGGGTTASGGAASGGSGMSGTAFSLPGIGDVSWLDLLKVGGGLAGALAGAKGSDQSVTTTKELPDYLKEPVAGNGGLIPNVSWLMNQQLHQPGLVNPRKHNKRGLL